MLIHQHRLDRRLALRDRRVELLVRQRHRVGTEPGLVRVQLDRAEPARIPQHEVATVGEVHAESMPLRDAPIARVEQRVTRFDVVDEHPPAHTEMNADAHVGIFRVEHDLLAAPPCGRERVADQRVPQCGRGRSPLHEPGVGRVHLARSPVATRTVRARRGRLRPRGSRASTGRLCGRLRGVPLWDEVGDDCFRRRYDSFDLNIGVVRGSDGFLVIDTRCHAGEARELLDDLRELGSMPVRRIVNSHWHFDHCWGNATIRAVSPGVEIWGHAHLAAPDAAREIEESKEWLRVVRPEWADELDHVEIVPPDHLVTDEATIDLGNREVTLRHPGRGHTDNDIVVVVPDADVVFAGDIVEESGPPAYGTDCFPLDWPATNARLLEWITPDRDRRARPRRCHRPHVRRRRKPTQSRASRP